MAIFCVYVRRSTRLNVEGLLEHCWYCWAMFVYEKRLVLMVGRFRDCFVLNNLQ